MTFMTENDQEWFAKTLLVPIPGPEGTTVYRHLSHNAHASLQAMRDIGEPDQKITERTLAMVQRTGLPYEDCLSFVVMMGPVD